MATNAVVTETMRIHDRSHISKLNEFATESNFQALQHNYRDNIIPYFQLISPRTHKPYFKHTSHTHTSTSPLHIQTHSAAYISAHGGILRTDKLTHCAPPMTGKNRNLSTGHSPSLRPGKRGGTYCGPKNTPDHMEC